MTRIAMIVPTLDAIGGAERQVMLLAKELSARGWEITVITLSGSANSSIAELRAAGVAWLSLEMRKAWIDPRGWRRYLAWAALNKPEIIHTHLPHATWFARCVRIFSPIRIQIDTLHSSHAGGLARRLSYRLTHWLTNRVTCVSAAVARSAEAAGLAPRRDLNILTNGVPILPPSPPSLERTERPAFRWISVGRLAVVKDYPTLLRAFATLPGEPVLAIAGSGPEEHTLRRLAFELAIGNRVQFAGFHAEIQSMLTAADAFVLASRWEGLPVSILEAAAASLPAVVTDAAGTRETILANETGILVPVGDVPALASAMAEMMTMPPRQRREMGNRARQFIEKRFALTAVVTQWEDLYAQLLEDHPHPSRHG